MVCDRLAELGLAVGPDTARALLREILAAEAPRVDARLRDALDTSLQTIRIATQSAMGLLATTASDNRPKESPGRDSSTSLAARPRRWRLRRRRRNPPRQLDARRRRRSPRRPSRAHRDRAARASSSTRRSGGPCSGVPGRR